MNQSFKIALLKSSGLHLAIVIAFVVGAWFKPSKPTIIEVQLNPAASSPKQNEEAIEAVAVDNSAVEKRLSELRQEEARKKTAEQKRIRDLEKRAAAAEEKRKAEARRIAKLEKERKQKEREKKDADEKAKKAKEKQRAEQKKADDAKKKAEQLAAQRKKEEEKLKQAEEKRKRDEALTKKRAEEQRQRALEEQLLQEQLAQEAAARSKARQAQVLTEVEKYKALIVDRIKNNFYSDQATMQGKECQINMQLACNGLVTKVDALGGDTIVCNEAIRAIKRVEQFPVPKDRDVFKELQTINLTYRPEFKG